MNKSDYLDSLPDTPLWLRVTALVILLLLTGVVFDSHAQPRILSAQADPNGTLLIRGIGLLEGASAAPQLLLGDRALTVCSACSTDSYVVAQLPDALPAGRQPVRFQTDQFSRDFMLTVPARTTAHRHLPAARIDAVSRDTRWDGALAAGQPVPLN